jgi:UDP-3-O-[3-hydroxymyristoyl] glucosamine N-acyltransferase
MPITVSQIAELVRGEVSGDGSVTITGCAAAENAKAGDLTFADKERHFLVAEQSQASAILVAGTFTSESKTLIRVPDARVAMARLLPHFFPPKPHAAGIHPTAVIAATAQVDPTAHIGPHVVIGENVVIGARTALLGGNHVGHDSRIGEDTTLYPGVILYPHCKLGHRVGIHSGCVIGGDGYGYVLDGAGFREVLQIGDVVIEDDVEIGAGSTVDRAAFGSTIIGAGTKVDNLVHLAHNVKIGKNSIIMGQVGIAGSTEIGSYTVVASQTGIAGHLKIGNQVHIGAKSGLMRDVPDGSKILGVPAVPDKQTKRQWLAVQQLPELMKRVRELEKQIAELTAAAPKS